MLLPRNSRASQPRLVALLAVLAATSACASANRDGARALSTAGVDAASAISTEVAARATRLTSRANVYNFTEAYEQMRSCPAGSITNTGQGGTCDVLSMADQLRDGAVAVQMSRVANIVRLRGRALDQLAAAYRALGAEADYDARTDFETKITAATEGVNTLAVAVGLGPLPQLATAGARILGGQLATNAQQRRLERGSARLRELAIHLRAALVAEQRLHTDVDNITTALDANSRRALARAGLVPALPSLKDVITTTGFPSPGDSALQGAIDRDAALAAAGRVTALSSRPPPLAEALQASITVLDALIAKHRDFEAGQPLSLADLTATVARLTELVEAAKADFADDDGPEQGGP